MYIHVHTYVRTCTCTHTKVVEFSAEVPAVQLDEVQPPSQVPLLLQMSLTMHLLPGVVLVLLLCMHLIHMTVQNTCTHIYQTRE